MRRLIDALTQSVQGMARNGLVTFVSIFVLVSCLIFVGSFSLISKNIDYNLASITELNEIEVFLEYELDDAAAAEINAEIAALQNVASTTLVSKEEGLEQVKGDFPDYSSLFDNINAEDNPLSHKIIVIYEENDKVSDLDFAIKRIEGVRKVNSRLDIAASANSLQKGISLVFVWFTVLCSVVCMFVIINTIKLSVYSRREEITIMRYIGASRTYIAAPFVLEGMFIGICGALVAFLGERLIYSALMGFVSDKMGFVKLYAFSELAPELLIVFFGISLFCGIIGSLVSLGKYVEV
ncbi:MAG: permease-like cell division protein FtsX [Clostridia bacterium]|nr:permease-like cell division protein FtsX [Clostridia bacterium]